MKKLLVFTLYIVLLGSTSCLDDPDCTSTATDFVNIQFYDQETGEVATVKIDTLRAINSDFIFLEDTTVTSIRLPLEANMGITTYSFESELGVDTISFTYSNRTRFVSDECGIELIFAELEFTRSDFDSTAIVNTNKDRILTEEVIEDVEIYN